MLPRIVLGFDKKTFIFQVPFEKRHLAKEAGFIWSKRVNSWITKDPYFIYKKLGEVEVTSEVRERVYETFAPQEIFKFAYDSHPPDKKLDPHQKSGAKFLFERNISFLADDVGLGKTIQAIICHNAMGSKKTLIICPPFLCENWLSELENWLKPLTHVHVLRKKSDTIEKEGYGILVVPDSIVFDKEILKQLREMEFNFCIVDEAHRFKNANTRRTRAVLGTEKVPGIIRRAGKVVLMSATPLDNKPIQLWPLIYFTCPAAIGYMNEFEFGQRFCGARWNGYGWDYKGAENLEELRDRLFSSFMLRREGIGKQDPLLSMLVLSPTSNIKKAISQDFEKFGSVKSYAELDCIEPGEIATRRQELSLEKLKSTMDYIENHFDTNPDRKLVVFAIHKEFIRQLALKFKKLMPATITGDTPTRSRQSIVDDFLDTPSRKLLIGNIQAMGVGLNIQRNVCDVAIVELPWLMTDIVQAVGRVNRRGQKDQVRVKFLVWKNSLDELFVKSLLKKKEIFNTVIAQSSDTNNKG